MRHDQAGDFRGLPGFFFAGLRAFRDRQCQACQTELITGEPVFRISASFKAVVNNQYSNGAYCTPCAVAQIGDMQTKLAEAAEWLKAQHAALEPYFVAKTLGGKQDRCKLTQTLRKLLPKEICPACFHDRSDHLPFDSFGRAAWKCGHSDSDPSEEGTVQCCGCNRDPKLPKAKVVTP